MTETHDAEFESDSLKLLYCSRCKLRLIRRANSRVGPTDLPSRLPRAEREGYNFHNPLKLLFTLTPRRAIFFTANCVSAQLWPGVAENVRFCQYQQKIVLPGLPFSGPAIIAPEMLVDSRKVGFLRRGVARMSWKHFHNVRLGLAGMPHS